MRTDGAVLISVTLEAGTTLAGVLESFVFMVKDDAAGHDISREVVNGRVVISLSGISRLRR